VLPAGGAQRLSRAEVAKQVYEIEQVMDFRLATECAAARLAALHHTAEEAARIQELHELQEEMLNEAEATEDDSERARLTTRFLELDNRFHLAIAAASHNHYLAEAVETARINMQKPVGGVFARTYGDVHSQHQEIAEAIAGSDPETAARAMADHVEATRTAAKEHLTKKAGRKSSS
jgi:DNA-binding GntR family transcriptional regulator